MKFIQHNFFVDDFCHPRKASAYPAHTPFADHIFSVFSGMQLPLREQLVGPGIYAICFEKKLIYIGKYLGEKKNPFAGNVAHLRWVQHLGSMTMRDRRVSLSNRTLQSLLKLSPSLRAHPLLNSLLIAFSQESEPASKKPFLQRDRGCLSTFNRIIFALEHWAEFCSDDGPNTTPFTFHYFRLLQPETNHSTETIRFLISSIEDEIVLKFRPRCNAVIMPGTATTNHAQPQALDTIGEYLQRRALEKLDSAAAPFSSPSTIITKSYTEHLEKIKEPEDLTAEMDFFEKLETAPPIALEFINKLREYVYMKDDIELHFTSSNKGDLRLRKHGIAKNQRASQNFLTLVWQPRHATFRINNLTRIHQHTLNPHLSNLVRPLLSDPLGSTMKVNPETALANHEDLISWIEKGRTLLEH